jgi:hypothetical protein
MIPYWGAFFNGSLWEVFVAGFFVPVIQENCWNTKKTSNEHFAYFCGEIFVFWGGEEIHAFETTLFT